MSRILARVLGDPGGPASIRPRLPMMFEPGLDLAPGPDLPAPGSQGRYDVGEPGVGGPWAGEPGAGEPGGGEDTGASSAAAADAPARPGAWPSTPGDPVRPRLPAMFEHGLGLASGPRPRATDSLGRYGAGEPGAGQDAHESEGVAVEEPGRPRARHSEPDDPMRSPGMAEAAGADAAMAGPGRPIQAHPVRPAGTHVAGALAWPSAHGGADVAPPATVSLAELAAGQAAAAQPARQYLSPDPRMTAAARERRAASPASAEPVVRISIGRVEIRADRTDAPRPARPAARPRQPGVELSEYLRRRGGRR